MILFRELNSENKKLLKRISTLPLEPIEPVLKE